MFQVRVRDYSRRVGQAADRENAQRLLQRPPTETQQQQKTRTHAEGGEGKEEIEEEESGRKNLSDFMQIMQDRNMNRFEKATVLERPYIESDGGKVSSSDSGSGNKVRGEDEIGVNGRMAVFESPARGERGDVLQEADTSRLLRVAAKRLVYGYIFIAAVGAAAYVYWSKEKEDRDAAMKARAARYS
jgi:hypothetical protein